MRFFTTLVSPLFGMLRSLFDPTRWFELPRKLGRLSLPALAALGTVVFLSISLLAVFLKIRFDSTGIPLLDQWFTFLPILLFLVAVISAVVYYAVYLWQLPEYELFDDLQTAWEKGLAELEHLGLQLYDLPLFLVLGVEDPERVHQLFMASGLEWALANYPAGRSALHWYAGNDGVFVVCSDVGCLTRIAQRATQRLQSVRSSTPAATPSQNIDLSRTCWPTPAVEVLDQQPAAEASRPPPSVSPPPSANAPLNMGQTLEVPAEDLRRNAVASDGSQPPAGVNKQRLALDRDAMNEQIARCEQLGRLIVAARQPRAPLNGIVTLLPLNMLLCDASEGPDVKEAASLDLQTLVGCLRLRCPTYAIVSGWEDDLGFQELVRRLPSNLKDNRFGKGNRPGDSPIPDRLEAVAKNAVAAFEDWTYHLFKQPEATTKPGNRQLYTLLCKVRRYLNSRLIKVVADGYSCEEHEERVGLFGGCYFTAAGRHVPSQAFVRGVFQNIVQQHKELAWTRSALHKDRLARRLAFTGFATALGLLMLTVVLVLRSRG
ncbi:MAG: hypothetical protein NTY19_29680 [Planctomycetota bacterium]|nr:hypothetical protein [Planctomycetota bacterium]